jgi:hypothetical protein
MSDLRLIVPNEMAQKPSTLPAQIDRQSSDAAVQQSPLLKAPAEIRLKIYQALFDGAQVRLNPSDRVCDRFDSDENISSILRVCRLLRKEAPDVYFSLTTFSCPEFALWDFIDRQEYCHRTNTTLLSTDMRRVQKLVIPEWQRQFIRSISAVETLVNKMASLRDLTWKTRLEVTVGIRTSPGIHLLRKSEALRHEHLGGVLLDGLSVFEWSKALARCASHSTEAQTLCHGLMHFRIRYIHQANEASRWYITNIAYLVCRAQYDVLFDSLTNNSKQDSSSSSSASRSSWRTSGTTCLNRSLIKSEGHVGD